MSEQPTGDAPKGLTEADALSKIKALYAPAPVAEKAKEPVQETEPQEAPEEADGQAEEYTEGYEGEDQQSHDEDGDEGPTYQVTLDGVKQEVTLKELLSGYQQAKVSTQRFEEASKLRREVQEERAVLSEVPKMIESVSQKLAYLERADQLIEMLAPQLPSDEVLKANPVLYMKAKEAREAVAAQRNALRQAMEESQAQAKQMLQVAQAHARQMLKAEMPDILTSEGSERLTGYLRNIGFSDEQIAGAADHRLFVMAEKARKYDEIMSRPVQKTKPAPKVTSSKPTTRPSGDPRQSGSSYAKAVEKVKTSGSLQDGAAAYLALRNRNKT